MSVLRFLQAKLSVFSHRLWRGVAGLVALLFRFVPVVLAVIASAFAVAAMVVLVLVATHLDELKLLVGTGTTIMILIAVSGLTISSIGVLIAALRYATDHNSSRQTLEQHSGSQAITIVQRRADHTQ